MLKKKTLTETIYNNGDPFQIREAISAAIGAWQKREDAEILWEALDISTEVEDSRSYTEVPTKVYVVSVEAVYHDNVA